MVAQLEVLELTGGGTSSSSPLFDATDTTSTGGGTSSSRHWHQLDSTTLLSQVLRVNIMCMPTVSEPGSAAALIGVCV